MATQFGFSDGQTNQASVLPQVFIQNASVSGSASAIVSGITATGRLGMLGVGISGGSGVMSMAGGFQLSGSGSTVAGSQVTADDLKTNAVTNLGGFAKALTLDGSALLTLPITVNDGFLSLPGGANATDYSELGPCAEPGDAEPGLQQRYGSAAGLHEAQVRRRCCVVGRSV